MFPSTGAPRVGDGDHITVEFIHLETQAQNEGGDEDVSLLQAPGTIDTHAESRFRAVPAFLIDDPCWCISHKIDGSSDPPILVRDHHHDTPVHGLTRGTPEMHADNA